MSNRFKLFFIVLLLLDFKLILANSQISGFVKEKESGYPVSGANVFLHEISRGDVSDSEGYFQIANLDQGTYSISASHIGFISDTISIELYSGQRVTVEFMLEKAILELGKVIVYTASRHPQQMIEAPVSVSTLREEEIDKNAITGQVPRLFDALPGIDIVQNGMNDYNINARGFNSVINRRTLFLLDHRDISSPLASYIEWNTFNHLSGDLERVEVIRGPGSALYGANAFAGVVNMVTPRPRDIIGTKITLTGGELGTLSGDVRHAGVIGRWGYKLNIGRTRSETWDKSRNMTTDQIAEQEYAGLPSEVAPLPENILVSTYGSARLDYTFKNQSYVTLEGGMTQGDNITILTGPGRFFVNKVQHPFARLAYTSDRTLLQAAYSSRKTAGDHELDMASGWITKEDSYDLDFFAQTDFSLLDERLEVVAGASHRIRYADDLKTLLPQSYRETYSGLFGHADLKLLSKLKLVGALRMDASSIHETQISPKLAMVFSPKKNHVFRASYNRAFLSPIFIHLYIDLPLAAPVDLAGLETAIESALETEQGLPAGSVDLPLHFGSTPVVGLGNPNLDVEKVVGYEIGYKGILNNKAYFTLDLYYNQLKDFITVLSPGVNPAYPAYSVPDEIDPDLHPMIYETVQQALGNSHEGFTTLPDGNHAIVYSIGNASKVNEWGIEIGMNYHVTDALMVGANYTFFEYDIMDDNTAFSKSLSANTPKHKFNIQLDYNYKDKIDFNLHVKHVDTFRWVTGVFNGKVPSYTLVNIAGGYRLNKMIRLGFSITNALNKKHYQMFGGSLMARRALGSISFEF